jgi:hypothetical protein
VSVKLTRWLQRLVNWAKAPLRWIFQRPGPRTTDSPDEARHAGDAQSLTNRLKASAQKLGHAFGASNEAYPEDVLIVEARRVFHEIGSYLAAASGRSSAKGEKLHDEAAELLKTLETRSEAWSHYEGAERFKGDLPSLWDALGVEQLRVRGRGLRDLNGWQDLRERLLEALGILRKSEGNLRVLDRSLTEAIHRHWPEHNFGGTSGVLALRVRQLAQDARRLSRESRRASSVAVNLDSYSQLSHLGIAGFASPLAPEAERPMTTRFALERQRVLAETVGRLSEEGD